MKYMLKHKEELFLDRESLDMSIKSCCNMPLPDAGFVTISIGRNGMSLNGVVKCHSLWACPVCTETKQSEIRRKLSNIVKAISKCYGSELQINFNTLTLSHRYQDSLEETFDILTQAWRSTSSNRQVNKKRKGQWLGAFRWAEVTYGNNGFHPHYHFLEFAIRPYSYDLEIENFVKEVIARGRNAIESVQHFREISLSKALKVADYPWSEHEDLEEIEETQSSKKKSFLLKERLLALKTSDRVLKEYLIATKSRHSFHISPFLNKFAIESQDQDDLEEKEVLKVPGSVWGRASKIDKNGLFVENVSLLSHNREKLVDYLLTFTIDDYESKYLLMQRRQDKDDSL